MECGLVLFLLVVFFLIVGHQVHRKCVWWVSPVFSDDDVVNNGSVGVFRLFSLNQHKGGKK